MKSSGLGWAGDVPAHWDVAKICMVARLESGHTPSRQHPEYWVPEECTIPWFSLSDVWQLREGKQEYLGETKEKISSRGLANSAARLLPAGTVVLSRTASVGFSGIMPLPMSTTQDFANWVCGPRIVPEFLLYALRAMEDEFRRATMGSTHQTIYMPDIRRLAVPVPPVAEQRSIVDRLRTKLPRLDDLIEKKERLLTVLHESRQAFVTAAVTKGLNPQAEMLAGGIEWLDSIPAHWHVRPLKRLLSFGPKNGISPPPAATGTGVPSFSISAVRDGRVDVFGNLKSVDLSERDARAYYMRPRDILLVRGNGNLEMVGACGLVEDFPEGCTYPDILMLLRSSPLVLPEFLVAAINSPYVRAQIELAAQTSNGTYKVSGGDVRNLLIVVPPLHEQQAIVNEVAASSDAGRQHQGLLQRLRSQLEKRREYRQAIITSAVTGKLDWTTREAA